MPNNYLTIQESRYLTRSKKKNLDFLPCLKNEKVQQGWAHIPTWQHLVRAQRPLKMGIASFISLGPHLSFTALHMSSEVFQDRNGELSVLSDRGNSKPLYTVSRGFPLVHEGLEDAVSSGPDPADMFILRQEILRIQLAPSYPCGVSAKPSLLLQLTCGSSHDIASQVRILTCNSVC